MEQSLRCYMFAKDLVQYCVKIEKLPWELPAGARIERHLDFTTPFTIDIGTAIYKLAEKYCLKQKSIISKDVLERIKGSDAEFAKFLMEQSPGFFKEGFTQGDYIVYLSMMIGETLSLLKRGHRISLESLVNAIAITTTAYDVSGRIDEADGWTGIHDACSIFTELLDPRGLLNKRAYRNLVSEMGFNGNGV